MLGRILYMLKSALIFSFQVELHLSKNYGAESSACLLIATLFLLIFVSAFSEEHPGDLA